jgi:apolipoprotein N-acyltransferase
LALAFPKVGAAWLAPVGAAALFWIWREASWKRAFGLGWFAGLVFFSITFSWFGYTVGAYVGAFAPVLVLVPAAFQALYFGAAGAATAWAQTRAPRWGGPLAFGAAFAIFESLRSIGTFGAPFGQIGTSQASTSLGMLAAYVGTYGVTFVVCATGGFAVDAIVRKTWRPFATFAIALVAVWTLGWAFWPARHAPPATVPVAAIQGNITQSLKWTPQMATDAIVQYQNQTRALAAFHPQLVVWPETAVAEELNRDPQTMASLSRLARSLGTTLVVGAQRAHEPDIIYNSLYIFDTSGLRSIYDKRQMVPIVETMPPYFTWLPYVAELGGGEMTGGTHDGIYTAGGLTFAPLICWESAFADIAHAQVTEGAQIFVIATDDAWFGDTAGPPMHAQIAQMRAIENGMWVVRAASTGVSGIIAPDGTYAARADVGVRAVVRGTVGPPAGSIFASLGPGPIVALLALLYLALVGRRHARA